MNRRVEEALVYTHEALDRLPGELKTFSDMDLYYFVASVTPDSVAQQAGLAELKRREGRPALMISIAALALSAIAITVSIFK